MEENDIRYLSQQLNVHQMGYVDGVAVEIVEIQNNLLLYRKGEAIFGAVFNHIDTIEINPNGTFAITLKTYDKNVFRTFLLDVLKGFIVFPLMIFAAFILAPFTRLFCLPANLYARFTNIQVDIYDRRRNLWFRHMTGIHEDNLSLPIISYELTYLEHSIFYGW